jgi:hypothetical protein
MNKLKKFFLEQEKKINITVNNSSIVHNKKVSYPLKNINKIKLSEKTKDFNIIVGIMILFYIFYIAYGLNTNKPLNIYDLYIIPIFPILITLYSIWFYFNYKCYILEIKLNIESLILKSKDKNTLIIIHTTILEYREAPMRVTIVKNNETIDKIFSIDIMVIKN